MPKPEDLRIGDNLTVILIGGSRKFYRITGIDELFYKDVHAPLSAAATESFANVTNLNPPSNELIWIGGIGLDGNIELQLRQPASTNRWGTALSPSGGFLIDVYSPVSDPVGLNIWISKDYPPATQLVNNTNVTINNPILRWFGKRFAVEERPSEGVPTTVVKVGGLTD